MTSPGVPTRISTKSTKSRIHVADEDLLDENLRDDSAPRRSQKARPREESGVLARAALDHVDDLIRKQMGSGIPSELKEIAVDAVRQRVDNWLVASREDRPRADSSAGPGLVARPAFVLAVVTAIVLALAVVVGSIVAMELTNRLLDMDRAQTERVTGLEARIADAENLQLELKATALAQDTLSKNVAADLERRVKQAEARQDALVIYLLEGINKLLIERKISPPDVPPILQIAQAQIMLQKGQ